LIEMALSCPRTSEELTKIPGVGSVEAARHGAIILSTIADCLRE
jgi:superfamily II DNA helicase RecQ